MWNVQNSSDFVDSIEKDPSYGNENQKDQRMNCRKTDQMKIK